MLLAAAYPVYEEALVDRCWFTPSHWHQAGLGEYAEVWGTSLLMATHLTAFHIAVSVTSSVVLTVSPVVLGVLWLRHSVDALQIVVGWSSGSSPLLSIAVGLLGRYDTSLLGVLTLVALVGVRRRHARVARPAC